MTALSALSKADTVFLCEPAGAGAAALIIDASQERTNLTNSTTYVRETTSARTALGAPRNITVIVDMTTTSANRLIQHGSGAATYSYAINKSGSNLTCAENSGGILLTVAIPGLAVTARKVLVHWSQRVEGASVLSECAVYNFVSGQWAFGSLVHAATTPSATDTFTICAGSTGGNIYSLGVTAFHMVHVGRRFHSTTEASIDHVAVPTPPSMTGQRRSPLPTGTAAELGVEDGAFTGPSFLWALGATREADSRLVGPLVNLNLAAPYSEVYTPVTRYNRAAPGAPTYRLSTRWLWHAWPGPKVNSARVRIHVAVTGGGGVCPIYFRCMSIADLPMGQPNPPPLSYYSTPTATIAASTGAAGVWLDLGTVRLARDASGMTALALALDFNHGGGDIYTTNVKIRTVTIEPYTADLSGGGNGDTDDKEAG